MTDGHFETISKVRKRKWWYEWHPWMRWLGFAQSDYLMSPVPEHPRTRFRNWWAHRMVGYDVRCVSCKRVQHVRNSGGGRLYLCGCTPRGSIMELVR